MELFAQLPGDDAGVMMILGGPGVGELQGAGGTANSGPTADATGSRELVRVFADEAVPGDRVRDHGVMRQITSVEASVVQRSVVLFFDPADGFDDQLHVPLFQTVSVWRVS